MLEGFDFTQYYEPLIITGIIAICAVLAELILRHFIMKAANTLGVSKHQIGAISSLSKIIIGLIATTVIIFQFSNTAGIIASTVSLASGTIIGFASMNTVGNAIAGILLLISKPFKIGDMVSLGDDEKLVGEIAEITLLFTKIRTNKNELLSIPNQMLLQRHIVNFSGLEYVALPVYISMSYTEHRDRIESLLIESAKNVNGVIENPSPYVILLRFDDFGCTYELRAYTNEPTKYFKIQSLLRKKIYDVFQKNGLDLSTVRIVKTLN